MASDSGSTTRSDDSATRRHPAEDLPLSTIDVADDAHRFYGRRSGHPARLNLGDTFGYALAYVSDEPLLYVGSDFSHTDIRSALDEPGGSDR